MRVLRLRLRNYRGIADHEVRFAPTGVTVVEGPNEVGKTSLAEALDLLFDYRDDSTHRAVKAVKPAHRDAGAEVEADIEAGPYRFTYAKRFHRDRATTITVSAPRPENLTGRPAHERALSILSEHADVALWKALRLQQGVHLEQADLSRQTSLAAALDAAAAGALAGDREATLVDLAQTEYERYFTAKGHLRTEVARLAEEEAAANARVEALRRRLAELDDDVEHCAALVRGIAQLDEQATEQAERVARYRDQWKEVDALLGRVERARLAADLAAERARAAADDLARREAMRAAVATAEREALDARQEHDLAMPALVAATEALDTAFGAARAAARAAEDAAVSLRQARAAYDTARDHLDLTLLTERLDRVRHAQRELASVHEELETNRVDERVLAEADEAHVSVTQARARADGARPVLVVEAMAGVRIGAGADATDLAPGQIARVPLAPESAIELGEAARVRVELAHDGSPSPMDALAAAERRFADALARAGVPTIEEARVAARARRDAERSAAHLARTLKDDLRDLTPDLMEAKVVRLAAKVGEATGAAVDLDRARQRVEDAERTAAQASGALADAEEEVANLRAAHARLRDRADDLARAVALAEQRLDVARQALANEQATAGDDVLAARAAEAAAAARDAKAELAAAEGAAERARPEELRATLDNAEAVFDKLTAERAGAERTLTEVRARLALLGEEGLHDRLAEAEGDLDHRRRERRRTEAKAAAARRLYETLVRCRDEARQAYVAPLKAKIESLARIVYETDDVQIELGEDLRIARRTLRGVTLDFEQLSTGAREQLCVLSRLACASLVAADGGVPVILDDALGWSDPARLERLGAAFNVAAQQAQVIVLTCVPERYRQVGTAERVRLAGGPPVR